MPERLAKIEAAKTLIDMEKLFIQFASEANAS
jgi:hypothetical protein